MTTTIPQFLSMIASFNATGDNMGAGEPKWVQDAEDCVEVVDNIIAMARKLVKAEIIPTKNFMEGGWSFRFAESNGKPSFSFYPKGLRHHWSSRGNMQLTTDGKTWMFIVFHGGSGRSDARPSFAEAKAEVLRLLGAPAKDSQI